MRNRQDQEISTVTCPVDGKNPIVLTFSEGNHFLYFKFLPIDGEPGWEESLGHQDSTRPHTYHVCSVGHVTVANLGDNKDSRTNVIRVVGDTAMGKSYLLSEMSQGPPAVGAVEQSIIFGRGKTVVSRRASFAFAHNSLSALQKATRTRLAPTEVRGDSAADKVAEYLTQKLAGFLQLSGENSTDTATFERFDDYCQRYFRRSETSLGRSPSLVLYVCQYPIGPEDRVTGWTGITYLCDMPGEEAEGALGADRVQERASELRHADSIAYLVDAADLDLVRRGLPERHREDLKRARRLSTTSDARAILDMDESRRSYYEVLTNYLAPENDNIAKRSERVIVLSKSDLIWAALANNPDLLLPHGQPAPAAVEFSARYLFRYAKLVRDRTITCSDVAARLLFSDLDHASLEQEMDYLRAISKAVQQHFYQADNFLGFITNRRTESFSFQVNPGSSAFAQEIIVPAEDWLDYVCQVGDYSLQLRDVISAILAVPLLQRMLDEPSQLVQQLDASGNSFTFAFATVPVRAEDGSPDNAWHWDGMAEHTGEAYLGYGDLRPDYALWAKLNFKHFVPPHWR